MHGGCDRNRAHLLKEAMPVRGMQTNSPEINQRWGDYFSAVDREVSDKASDEEALRNNVDQMAKDAEGFRSRLPGRIETETGLAGSNIRKGLAEDILGIKRNASSRGLLHSGLRGAQESEARSNAAQDVLSVGRGVRERLYGQAQDMADQAIQAGLQQQQMQLQRNQREYNTALEKRMQRQQMGSKIGGMIGGIGGMAAGGGFSSPRPEPG